MRLRLKFSLMLLILFVLCLIPVYASEGEPYMKDDGFWYVERDGEEYRLVTGDDNGSLTDVIKGYSDTTKVSGQDKENLNNYGGKISNKVGYFTSFVLWCIFALIGFTTACDFLFICVPFLRIHMYKPNSGGSDSNSKEWCLISNELKYIMSNCQVTSTGALVIMYSKKRAFSVIYTVVVIVLLILSSVITDFGFNIGGLLLSLVK